MAHASRREFLGQVGQAALAGALVNWPVAGIGMGAGGAGQNAAFSDDDLAKLVRWVREVKRERLVADTVDRVKSGLPLEKLYAAIFLAGIEDVEPRPVGFRFHCVMVMHSVWSVAQALPANERVLPLVFALDEFKQSQAGDAAAHNWILPPPQEKSLPSPQNAEAVFLAACEDWDVEKADAAVTVLARTAKRDTLVDLLAPYATRSFQDVGHMAIFAANSFHTLDTIGWSNAEPVLRSLVLGLLAPGPTAAAQPFERSKKAWEELASKYGPGGREGFSVIKGLPTVPPVLRQATPEQAINAFVTAARSVDGVEFDLLLKDWWDGLRQYALELLLRTPGLLAVHATTGVRALQWLAEDSRIPRTRLLALLQAIAWCTLWRDAFAARGGPPRDVRLPSLHRPIPDPTTGEIPADAAPQPEELLSDLGADRVETANRLVDRLGSAARQEAFLTAARKLLVAKGDEAHHWKFFVALDESLGSIKGSPIAAPRLAASCAYMQDAHAPDFGPVAEARAALRII